MTTTAASKKQKSRLGYSPAARLFLILFFTALAVLIMIPLFAMVLGTFKGGAELWKNGLNLRLEFEKWSIKPWRYLFTGVTIEGEYLPHDYFTWFRNSMFVTVTQTVLTLFISAFVAYGFEMYEFKLKNTSPSCAC